MFRSYDMLSPLHGRRAGSEVKVEEGRRGGRRDAHQLFVCRWWLEMLAGKLASARDRPQTKL